MPWQIVYFVCDYCGDESGTRPFEPHMYSMEPGYCGWENQWRVGWGCCDHVIEYDGQSDSALHRRIASNRTVSACRKVGCRRAFFRHILLDALEDIHE